MRGNANDTVRVRDLTVRALVGVTPDELAERQELIVNLWIGADLAPAARSDELRDAVDYSRLKKAVLRLADAGSFASLAHFAEAAAALCWGDPLARCAEITVEQQPGMSRADRVGATIRRDRPEKPPAGRENRT